MPAEQPQSGMANRAFLVQADGPPSPTDAVQEEKILCAASYTIPVFWFMLFDANSIMELEAPTEDDGVIRYHCLFAPREHALHIAQSRWPTVQNAIGPSYETLFKTFYEFIKAAPDRYVHCENGWRDNRA
jgi:hypothetical protein